MVETIHQNPPEHEIESILSAIEQAIQQKDFVWIQDLLDTAQKQEHHIQDRQQRVKLQNKVRQLRILRRQKIQELEDTIRAGLTADSLDDVQIENALDELAAIDHAHPTLDPWRTRLADQRQQARQAAHVQEIETQLKRLWREIEEAEQAGLHGLHLIGLYENARDYAERMAANYDLPTVKGLVQQATDLYNRARQRHEVATTRQQTGEYRSLLEQLRQMAPTEVVLVAKDMLDTQGSLTTMPAGEAIKLLENQAREYAAQKAADYRNKALEYLDDHAPRSAEKQLRLALDLFNLDQEQRTVTEKLLNERVIPALKQREETEAKLRLAERQSAPRRRWELLMEAQALDPFLLDVEKVRETLLPGIEAYLEERLREARRYLSDANRPDWAQAERLASEVCRIAEQDGAFHLYAADAESIRSEAENWHRLEQEIHEVINEVIALMEKSPDIAYNKLLALQATWGDRSKRFPQLAHFLVTLQARTAADPLPDMILRFFKQASWELGLIAEPRIYRCCFIPVGTQRLLTTPVYVWLSLERVLDSETILAIYQRIRQIDSASSTVLLVTDQRPTNDGWAQVGVLKMRGFMVLLIESTLVKEGIASRRERALLDIQLERWLGNDYDPYDVRDPVAGAFSFFGREPLVDTLLRRITNGQPVGIFGLRKLGKTSLLHAVRDHAPFPVAAVNLQAGGVYQRILRQWGQWARVHYQLEWQPPTIAEDNANTFITATLDLLDRAERIQTNVRLGLFLDEVELIVPRADGSGPSLMHYLSLFRTLRGLIDEDGRLSLVAASLNPTLNRINAWHGEQNPTFSLFQEINLPPLTHEDCKQMVLNIGQQIGLVYTDAALVAISELSGGHPFLARQLCSTLYSLRDRQVGQVEEAEIQHAAERFIYDDATVQHLDEGIWQDVGNQKLWGADNAKLNQVILLALAQAGEPQSRDILLNAADADARQSALINLEKFQVIHQPEPTVYAIQFGLLQRWLRTRILGLS